MELKVEPKITDTPQKTDKRRITIDPITRLEGHGKIEIFLNDQGNVENAYFQIPELRGFEQFCKGRPVEELARITPRLCGVCPGAHHMASAKALDAVFHAPPPPAGEKLRRLFYSAHYVHSHIAHFYALAAPDFVLGPAAPPALRNILGVVEKVGPEIGGEVIKHRSYAQRVQEILGGKATHPVCGIPGGMSRPISEEEREKILGWAKSTVDFSKFTMDLLSNVVLKNEEYLRIITNPDLYYQRTYYMGMVNKDNKVDFYDGQFRVVDPNGNEYCKFEPKDYLEHIAERVEPWTYLKFPYLKKIGWKGFDTGEDNGIYQVAPMARLNAAEGMKTPLAQQYYEEMFETFRDLGVSKPIHFTMAQHWARCIEIVQAAEEMLQLIEDPEITSKDIRSPVQTPDEGVGAVEAPRGVLIHHYWTDEKGITKGLNMIVGTGNNNAAICNSVRQVASGLIKNWSVSPGLLNMVEMAFRVYDPCFSCATHALPGQLPIEVVLRKEDGEVYKRMRNFPVGS